MMMSQDLLEMLELFDIGIAQEVTSEISTIVINRYFFRDQLLLHAVAYLCFLNLVASYLSSCNIMV